MSEKDSDKVDEKGKYKDVYRIARDSLELIHCQNRKLINKIPPSGLRKYAELIRDGGDAKSFFEALNSMYLTKNEQYECLLWAWISHITRLFLRDVLSDDEKKRLDIVNEMLKAAIREAKPLTDEEKEEMKKHNDL